MSTDLTVKSEQKPEQSETTRPGRTFVPKVDITETEEALWLWADLPGVREDAVDVRLDQGRLAIEGRVAVEEYASLAPVYTEYNVGSFVRTFQLTEAIDTEQIEARMSNGVLQLKLPKSQHARPRQIPISVA